jgi:hypothetical protein
MDEVLMLAGFGMLKIVLGRVQMYALRPVGLGGQLHVYWG